MLVWPLDVITLGVLNTLVLSSVNVVVVLLLLPLVSVPDVVGVIVGPVSVGVVVVGESVGVVSVGVVVGVLVGVVEVVGGVDVGDVDVGEVGDEVSGGIAVVVVVVEDMMLSQIPDARKRKKRGAVEMGGRETKRKERVVSEFRIQMRHHPACVFCWISSMDRCVLVALGPGRGRKRRKAKRFCSAC